MNTLLLVVSWDDFSPIGRISFNSRYNHDEEFLISEMRFLISDLITDPSNVRKKTVFTNFSWNCSAVLYSVWEWTLGFSVSLIPSSLRQSFSFLVYKHLFSLIAWGPVHNQNVRTSTESWSEKSLERLTVKRRASSASLQEETAKLPFHQLAFYCRASQQVCLSLHVLLTSCTVSSMVSRLFSAVVMHFTHFVCFGRPITLLSEVLITFFCLCVFLNFFSPQGVLS